jgi:hypothetical protein
VRLFRSAAVSLAGERGVPVIRAAERPENSLVS